MDKEMMKALEADGEKLRQLTGEDHGPYFFDIDDDLWADLEAAEARMAKAMRPDYSRKGIFRDHNC
jgi:hypothetical protein